MLSNPRRAPWRVACRSPRAVAARRRPTRLCANATRPEYSTGTRPNLSPFRRFVGAIFARLRRAEQKHMTKSDRRVDSHRRRRSDTSSRGHKNTKRRAGHRCLVIVRSRGRRSTRAAANPRVRCRLHPGRVFPRRRGRAMRVGANGHAGPLHRRPTTPRTGTPGRFPSSRGAMKGGSSSARAS